CAVLEFVFQRRKIDDGIDLSESVDESALGDTSDQRHLSAFEAGSHAASAARLLSLMSLAGSLAQAGAYAPAQSLGSGLGAVGGSEFVHFHRLTSLRLFHLDHMADLSDHA